LTQAIIYERKYMSYIYTYAHTCTFVYVPAEENIIHVP
jgi:hypothetical protein